jgi:hypothetical protein
VKGVGILVGAALTKEIATAGIAGLIKNIITGKGPGGGKGVPTPGGGAPIAGSHPAILAGIAGAGLSYEYGSKKIGSDLHKGGMNEDAASVLGGMKGVATFAAGGGPLGILADVIGREIGEAIVGKPRDMPKALKRGEQDTDKAASGLKDASAKMMADMKAASDALKQSADALKESAAANGGSTSGAPGVNRGNSPAAPR